ncbi:MAG TPA: RsmE family RNA methyltransferase [Gemmatimonadaceae bacterium]|nr:RsmE family RNA methyltransferase [Gemmatimonadaceae bacterium]
MVERGGGATVATFFVETAPVIGAVLVLAEAAARHARVRRLEAGDPVRLADGAGTIAAGSITRMDHRAVEVSVTACAMVERAAPLTLLVPVADRDRMLWLAEKAAEFGVTAWRPVVYARSRSVSPRGEGAGFDAKVMARMIGALEQSGGAWLPRIHAACGLDAAIDACGSAQRFVLHAGGAALTALGPFTDTAVAVGPEGGLEAEELALLEARGWRAASLGNTTLRFETAGVAAAAIVRATQGR